MSPRTSKQFEEIREEKKTLIMDTALEHFARNGYHATTIAHVARHAGISKGLMYNYFRSKEELLSAIIDRSVHELYLHLDPDRDGYLKAEEFELFVRKVTDLLIQKRTFWRLLFQMMMQNDVLEQFIDSSIAGQDVVPGPVWIGDSKFIPGVIKLMTDYFKQKAEREPADYDPGLEMKMFVMTLKGFAVTYIFMENTDELEYRTVVNRIIEQYR